MSEANVNWLSGLGVATQGGGGNYPRRGEYVAEIVSLLHKVSNNPKTKGHHIVVGDLRIVEVLSGYPDSNKVGETVGFYADTNGAYPSLELGKIKGILEAAIGTPSDAEIDAILAANGRTRGPGEGAWDALAAFLLSPPGDRLAGQRVRLAGVPVTTKTGKAIVVSRFAPLAAKVAAPAGA